MECNDCVIHVKQDRNVTICEPRHLVSSVHIKPRINTALYICAAHVGAREALVNNHLLLSRSCTREALELKARLLHHR